MTYEEKVSVPALRFARFLDKFPTLYNVYVVALISCVSALMLGFDISSMSALLLNDSYLKFFKLPSTNMQSFITASMSLGSMLGCVLSTFVSEPFGRRASLLVCSFFWCVGAAIQSSAQNRAQLIIGRIISGIGIGFGSTVAPVYCSEVSPRKRRGFIGGIFQLCVTIGILVMYYIAFGLGHINGLAAFRIPWAIQIVPGIILAVGVFFIPESPRWLAKQEQWEESEFIVAKIQSGGDTQHPDVVTEMAEIKEQLIIEENAKAFKYSDLLRKKYAFRTFNAIFAQIWQQLTGMNALMYYVTYIFQMAGYTGNINLIASSIQYVLNVVTTIPALFLMDYVGRRPVLITGAVFMLIWHFAIGGLLATYGKPIDNFQGNDTVKIQIPKKNKKAAKGVIACSYLFVCSYACSWGVVCWVYCAEVWGENAARQRGASLTTFFNWLFNFAIGMFTPPSFKNITWKTYMIFGAFCTTMALHVFFVFPETRGKRLEEIGQMWDNHIPAWKTDKWQPYVPIALEDENKHGINTEHKEHKEEAPSAEHDENVASASPSDESPIS